MLLWLNGTELALRVRDLGFDSHRLHFLFLLLFYLERKTTEPSRRFVSDS